MSIAIRVLLIVVSLFTFIYMLRKIRKSQLQIEHALFWIVFCGLLLILSIFPGIAIWISEVLGLQSPVNLVFLIIIFVLIFVIVAILGVGLGTSELFKDIIRKDNRIYSI